MRQAEILFMKYAILFALVLSYSSLLHAKDHLKDKHSTIYTTKVQRITSAINVGDFSSQDSYIKMLDTACQRNHCSPSELEGVRIVGEEIVLCRLTHLKAHGISNPDATSICETSQTQLACDTLATPLLRKMCYTGNNFSLADLIKKERQLKQRLPASAK